MKIQMKDPSKLKQYKANAKAHTDEQIEKLAEIIARDGFDQPIVVDAKMWIIKGHGRTLAALKLGLDEVPVIVRDDLSANEARLARIVDNETVDTEWDAVTLGIELAGIAEMGGSVEDTLMDELEAGFLSDNSDSRQPMSESPVEDLETKHECQTCGYKW